MIWKTKNDSQKIRIIVLAGLAKLEILRRDHQAEINEFLASLEFPNEYARMKMERTLEGSN